MKSRNYKISRDNIYVGKVVRANKIHRYEGDRTKPGQLSIESYFPCRSMLFVPNEEKLANDLLYQSPNYPILNVTDDETCLSFSGKNIIIVQNACNLSKLLKYFGYNKDLTFKDVMKIRKTFFTGKFAMDNCELFGFKETKPEDLTYYRNGVKVTDPKELKRLMNKERISQQAGHRSFSGMSESILPREYWDVLDKMGDNDLMSAIEWHEKMNAFAPHKQEGHIKKLTRF